MARTNPFLLVVPSSITLGSGFLEDFRLVKESIPLHEYQLYAVEQWVVDRSKHVPTIVVSTNDPNHKIIVDVLTPRAESQETKAAVWERAIARARGDGVRPKQTNLGFVLVVSLLGFRSDLSIVLVPDGDYLAIKEALYTNINLRRLGCGGRSGLTLSEASPSQQERFLQLYRLPGAAASGPNFPLAVIRTLQLVQAALALFNDGPCAKSAKRPVEPDGLLCDVTMNSLRDWQMNVYHTLPGGELGETPLSGAILAGLLSIVIAVRCRLLTMGVHHVPSDPFVDRDHFLRCYSAFMRTTRNAPDSDHLSVDGIQHLRQQYSRTTKESLKRAIRHRFDDIRGEGLSSGINKSAIMEEETTDINVFAAAVQANGGSDMQSLVNLWKGKFKRDKMYPRRSLPGQIDDADSASGDSGSESDDEAGFGKLLKGVSGRAKRLGGGVTGLLDKTGVRSSTGPGGSQTDRHELGRSRIGATHVHHGRQAPMGQHKADHQLHPKQNAHNIDNGLYRVSPYVSRSSIPSTSSLNASRTDLLEVPGSNMHSPTGRPPHMRRSITDQGAPIPSQVHSTEDHKVPSERSQRRHSFGSMREMPMSVKIMSVRRMKVDIDLHYGYALLKAREAYFANLVKALAEIDKAYGASLSELSPAIQKRSSEVQGLSERAKQLGIQVTNFTGTSSGTGQGTASARSSRAESVGSEPDSSSNTRAIVALAVGSERLAYSQTILEEKVRDVDEFIKRLLGKIGGSERVLDVTATSTAEETPGTIVKGLTELVGGSGGGRGTRKLLEVISLWSTWLAYLKGRVRSYF